jgi:hypothetical protein
MQIRAHAREGRSKTPFVADALQPSRALAHGSWTYRTTGPGEQIALTGGGTFALDPVYAGVFELPGE